MARRATKKKGKPMQPGYDGAEEYLAPVRVTMTRVDTRTIRCRPGTFEWRYGRKTADGTLYHAGCQYAVLYERAGTAAASSPDMESQGGGGAWKGLPDGRVAALDALKPINAKLDDRRRLRITAYCVEGLSVSDIAQWHGVPARDMAALIHEDMTALAKALHYL
jgi:hypothetical protein